MKTKVKNPANKAEMKSVGGQAVLEGVMMKSEKTISVAVRKPDGKIKVKKQRYVPWIKKQILFQIPVMRGFITFVESIAEGYRAMNFAASEAMEEESGGSETVMIAAGIFAFAFALFLFKFVPFWGANFISSYITAFRERFAFNFAEGSVKALILVGYIFAISRIKDIKRVFEYHGAEHKVINCYEAEGKVSVRQAKKYSTVHRRCGTSFLLLVVIVSIAVYIFIPLGASFASRFIWRIALLPVIAGISYEVLKASAKHPESIIFKLLSWPGAFLQKITTSEPDEKQLEVAVEAFKALS